MNIPMKPPKGRSLTIRVEDRDLEAKELLKSKGVDVAELHRQAIREAQDKAIATLKAS